MAVGLTAFKTAADGAITLAVGGYVGILIGIIIVMYFSGWIAGYLSRIYTNSCVVGALSGLGTWALALIIMVLVATHMADFVGANFQLLTNHKAVIAHVVDHTPLQKVVTAKMNDNAVQAVKNTVNKVNGMKQTAVTEDAVKNLGVSLLLIFVLFVAGALASVFGGCCGICSMKCGDKGCGDKTCSDKTCK